MLDDGARPTFDVEGYPRPARSEVARLNEADPRVTRPGSDALEVRHVDRLPAGSRHPARLGSTRRDLQAARAIAARRAVQRRLHRRRRRRRTSAAVAAAAASPPPPSPPPSPTRRCSRAIQSPPPPPLPPPVPPPVPPPPSPPPPGPPPPSPPPPVPSPPPPSPGPPPTTVSDHYYGPEVRRCSATPACSMRQFHRLLVFCTASTRSTT